MTAASPANAVPTRINVVSSHISRREDMGLRPYELSSYHLLILGRRFGLRQRGARGGAERKRPSRVPRQRGTHLREDLSPPATDPTDLRRPVADGPACRTCGGRMQACNSGRCVDFAVLECESCGWTWFSSPIPRHEVKLFPPRRT